MKNQYEKPVMVAEAFTPNNYVSSCDWWKAEATGTSATYYHDDGDNNVESGEDFTVNAPSIFYFKLSESSSYITQGADGNPSSLSKDVNDKINYYTDYVKHGNKYVYNHPNGTNYLYTGHIYEVVGYPSKGASTSATYWYTSSSLTCTKSAS